MCVRLKEDDGPPMDLRINMLIEATPSATMKIIKADPVAEIILQQPGNGNLQVNFFNKDFRMFGSWVSQIKVCIN